jgi:hypothetical protein
MTSTRVSVIATFKSFSYGVRGVPFFFKEMPHSLARQSGATGRKKFSIFFILGHMVAGRSCSSTPRGEREIKGSQQIAKAH